MANHSPHHSDSHDHGGHEAIGHLVSPKILIATAAALLVLTVITVVAAKVDFAAFDLKEMNIFVALGIAVCKASLVCMFFMHLRWDRPFNAFVLVGSLSLVALFIGFAMLDSTEYKPEVDALVKTYPGGETPTIKMELDKIPPAGTTAPNDAH